jgi:uncharacterized protein YkwD
MAFIRQLYHCLMKAIMFYLPFIFALFTACSSTLPAHTHPTTVTTHSTTINKTVLLQLVNDVRKKGCNCGDTYYAPAPPLKWNDQLENASQVHSTDMEKNRYFSHIAPDGSNGGERIRNAGYQWLVYGENIANGYKNEEEVIRGWIASPGHCKNIMNKDYTEMGIGRSGTYWTQVLATKK